MTVKYWNIVIVLQRASSCCFLAATQNIKAETIPNLIGTWKKTIHLSELKGMKYWEKKCHY